MHWRHWNERARPLALSSGPDTARPEAPGADATRHGGCAILTTIIAAIVALLLALVFNL